MFSCGSVIYNSVLNVLFIAYLRWDQLLETCSHYISHKPALFFVIPSKVRAFLVCHLLSERLVIANCHTQYTPQPYSVCVTMLRIPRVRVWVSSVWRVCASRTAAQCITLTDVTPVLTSNRHLDSERSHIQWLIQTERERGRLRDGVKREGDSLNLLNVNGTESLLSF